MEAASHLRLVDAQTGEVSDLPADVAELRERIQDLEDQLEGAKDGWAAAKGQIKKLRRELAEAMGVEPDADDIMAVLEYWRQVCMPGASIVIGSERWQAVRARLREKDAKTKKRLYTVEHLKAVVVGVMMSDFHVSNKKNGYLDAASIFSDSKKVDAHIARAIGFKTRTGISAMALVDELGGHAFDWLADRCSCGGLMIEHLGHGPGPLPCPARECPAFDFLHAKVERFTQGAA